MTHDRNDATVNDGIELEQLTQRDFHELPLETLQTRTGLEAPVDPSPAEEEAYRTKAWNSYRVDIENRDEWGTATQATAVPRSDQPDL